MGRRDLFTGPLCSSSKHKKLTFKKSLHPVYKLFIHQAKGVTVILSSYTGLLKFVCFPVFLLMVLSSQVFPQTDPGVSSNEKSTRAQTQSNPRASLGNMSGRVSSQGRVGQHTIQSDGDAATSLSRSVPLPVISSTSGHTFSTFSTGVITGGGASFIKSLDVSGLSNSEYLYYTISATYVPGTAPHDGYSSTMKMSLTDGASNVFIPATIANSGTLPLGGGSTLQWDGVMDPYTGGGNLTITFQDAYTDASGPYTSQVNNVTVTIYAAPQPKKTFATFSTGTITGAGAAFTK